MNKIILYGRVGQEPEVKHLDSGAIVAQLSLATSQKWKDKSTGETKEETQWHTLEVWGSQAKVVEQYVQKGNPLLIEGLLKYDQWTNELGEKKSRPKIRVNSLTLMPSGGGQQGQSVSASQQYLDNKSKPSMPNDDNPSITPAEEDELPF